MPKRKTNEPEIIPVSLLGPLIKLVQYVIEKELHETFSEAVKALAWKPSVPVKFQEVQAVYCKAFVFLCMRWGLDPSSLIAEIIKPTKEGKQCQTKETTPKTKTNKPTRKKCRN